MLIAVLFFGGVTMASEVKVPRLLKLKEVEAITGIARWRMYDLIQQGKGPKHMRIGKTIRISEIALVEWIDEREHQSSSGEE